MTGVTFDIGRNRWRASIVINSRHIHLGYHITYDRACEARREGETRYRAVKYDLRGCPVCGKTIPNISKRGNRLRKGHYDQKVTCGDEACVSQAIRVSRRGFHPINREEPYYQFCFGG